MKEGIRGCRSFISNRLYLIPLFYARIPGIRVHKFIVFPYQPVRRVKIMHVCPGHFH
jgi:hypothetical protein